jgi:uncharacterized protein (UPF0335 family)
MAQRVALAQIGAAVAVAARISGVEADAVARPGDSPQIVRARYVALAGLVEALPGVEPQDIAHKLALARTAPRDLQRNIVTAAWWKPEWTRIVADAVRQVDPTPDPVDGGPLKAFVERIERVEEEKKCLSDDVRDIYAEAKSNGYDVKTMRKIVAIRKIDVNQRNEEEAILDLYMRALGD